MIKRNKSAVRRKKKPDLVARNPSVQGYFKPDSSARHVMCLPTTVDLSRTSLPRLSEPDLPQ